MNRVIVNVKGTDYDVKVKLQESKSDSGYGRDLYVNKFFLNDNNEWVFRSCYDCRYNKDYDFRKFVADFVNYNWPNHPYASYEYSTFEEE